MHRQHIKLPVRSVMNKLSYNLFIEPWVEVVNADGREERLGLMELFAGAGELRRLNFSRPGYDLAVLRLLAGLVYLVGLPGGLREWKSLYEAGAFSEEFLGRLASLQGRFDLFDERAPFMQRAGEVERVNLSSVTELLKWVPGKSVSTHFYHGAYGHDNFPLCPACAVPALLSTQTFACSGGNAPNESGKKRSYLAGINGASPVFVSLHDETLYGTIILNVLNDSGLEQYRELGEMGANMGWQGERWESFLVDAGEIGIVEGIFWLPRGVRLLAEENVEERACALCSSKAGTLINSVDFRSGSYRVEGHWQDPMTARIDNNGEVSRASISGADRAERAGWRDYASFLFLEKREVRSLKAENRWTRFVPPLLQQSSRLHEGRWQVELFSFIVDTPSQPQIKKILRGIYDFSAGWLEDEQVKIGLAEVVHLTERGEYALRVALREALRGGEGKIIFEAAYWQGLEESFKDLLHRLTLNEPFSIGDSWRATLKGYLRVQYSRLTDHLVRNASLINGVERGRAGLERFIYNSLVKKEESGE